MDKKELKRVIDLRLELPFYIHFLFYVLLYLHNIWREDEEMYAIANTSNLV